MSDFGEPLVKTCRDCGEIKPLEAFPRSVRGRNGRGSYCLPCHNACGKANVIKNHGSSREYHLRARYGIGQADVDRMLAEQQGRCLGCDKPDPEHVDHDHEFGRVRGMLCFNCNQALGNVRDDPEVLRRLRSYVIVRRPGMVRSLGTFRRPPADLIIEVAGVFPRSA